MTTIDLSGEEIATLRLLLTLNHKGDKHASNINYITQQLDLLKDKLAIAHGIGEGDTILDRLIWGVNYESNLIWDVAKKAMVRSISIIVYNQY